MKSKVKMSMFQWEFLNGHLVVLFTNLLRDLGWTFSCTGWDAVLTKFYCLHKWLNKLSQIKIWIFSPAFRKKVARWQQRDFPFHVGFAWGSGLFCPLECAKADSKILIHSQKHQMIIVKTLFSFQCCCLTTALLENFVCIILCHPLKGNCQLSPYKDGVNFIANNFFEIPNCLWKLQHHSRAWSLPFLKMMLHMLTSHSNSRFTNWQCILVKALTLTLRDKVILL